MAVSPAVGALVPSRAAFRLHLLCGFFALASFVWGFVQSIVLDLHILNDSKLSYDTNLMSTI